MRRCNKFSFIYFSGVCNRGSLYATLFKNCVTGIVTALLRPEPGVNLREYKFKWPLQPITFVAFIHKIILFWFVLQNYNKAYN